MTETIAVLMKAPSPILVNALGIVTEVSAVQLSNTLYPTLVNESGSVTEAIPLQEANAR